VGFNARLAVIVLGPLAALAAVGLGRTLGVTAAGPWLSLLAAIYAAGFMIAWRFRNSFSVSLGRMLIWAVVAYLAISHIVDLVGQSELALDKLVGLAATDSGGPALAEIRALLAAWAAALVMSIISIAIGFENRYP
jgi:hypothetical protein